MGADGGICRVLVRKDGFEEFNALTGWFCWMFLNETAYSYRGDFAGPVPIPPKAPEGWCWLEGAFGTDCPYDLQDLVYLVRGLLDRDFSIEISAAALDLTLDEIVLDIETDPSSRSYAQGSLSAHERPWWSSLGVLSAGLSHVLSRRMTRDSKDYPLKDIGALSLRQWAQRLSAVIDLQSYTHEETWT